LSPGTSEPADPRMLTRIETSYDRLTYIG